tara:strand:+ start:160 stop:1623 length:1464 start_codon:yes stop_codon:yes gene_type:complete
MNRISTIILLIYLLASSIISAQNKFSSKQEKYKINGEITGLQDTSIMLAYYFGGKQYATDTAAVIEGKFTFSGNKKLKGGMYLVVLSDQKYFDIIISEQNFSFTTKIEDLIGSMKFKNSKENTSFYQYLNFITKQQKEIAPIRSALENSQGEEKLRLEKEVQKIDNKVKKYRSDFIQKNKNNFFSKIIKATTEIEIPESPLDSTGQPDKTFPYRYYKKHFWDNVDFSDERMLRTPIFFNKMDQYLEKLTAKHPDSINISADILIEKTRANDEIFEYVVSYITSTYERSKIMGMDAVFVHMVEKYYITNQCDWIDSTQLVKIIDRAQKIAPNLIGRVASEFVDFYGRPFMKDPEGKTHTLQEINAKYTILVFFGPTCGHCKKEMPKVKNVLDSLVEKNIDIKTFAVATEFDKEEWKKFIREQKTKDWLNVADINHDDEGNPVASSDWRDKYDIYSTPVIYLLDKEKKIIAKRITHKQIAEIIDRLENK